MKIARIDFESRSVADLGKVGSWNYARHESTEITCLAYQIPRNYIKLWTAARGEPTALFAHIEAGGLVEVHNVFFDRALWQHIAVKRLGWPEIPADQWRCSRALAAYHSLPQALANAAVVLGLRQQKDDVGRTLMLKTCKPRQPRKAEILAYFPHLDKKLTVKELEPYKAIMIREGPPLWHEDPADLRRLALYCGRDVATQRELSEALGELPPDELKIFQITMETNWIGIPCDLEAAEAAIEASDELLRVANKDVKRLTGGAATTINQSPVLTKWVNEQGFEIDNFQKATIRDALRDPDCTGDVKKVLQIRQDVGRSSVAKYKAMLSKCDPDDGRARDCFVYCGAHTHRWSGSGLQPQNLPRPDKGLKFDEILQGLMILKSDPGLFVAVYDSPSSMLAAGIRPSIRAPEGSTFICVDFSSVEAALTLWFCRDPAIDVIRRGACIYKALAGQIYNLDDPQSMEKSDPMRQHGKLGVLSGGYGTWWNTFQKTTLAQYDTVLSDELAESIIVSYREKFYKVRQSWYALEDGFKKAVRTRRPVRVLDRVTIHPGDPFFRIELPNGQNLFYFKPVIKKVMRFEKPQSQIYYWGVASQSKKWVQKSLYGGKILGHVIQSIARELLSDSLLKIDKDPRCGKLITTLHDEPMYEVDEKNAAYAQKEICRKMTIAPKWAHNCPISVEYWVGRNYRK